MEKTEQNGNKAKNDNSITYFGRTFSFAQQLIFFFGVMGALILVTVIFEGGSGDSVNKKNEIHRYTAKKFKSTIGYSSVLMRYTHGDLKTLIKYWGHPDEVFETYETDLIGSTAILRCSWNNVLVDGNQVDINFKIPDYYEITDVSDFTEGEIDMELADAAKVYSYQSRRR